MRDEWKPKPPYIRNGYALVNLVVGGKRKAMSIHRIIVSVFLGGIPQGLVVNHKDGDKFNNMASNLEVVTSLVNTAHAIKTGLMNTKGMSHPGVKLTDEEVSSIRTMGKTHKQRDIAALFNCSQSTVWRIINERSR